MPFVIVYYLILVSVGVGMVGHVFKGLCIIWNYLICMFNMYFIKRHVRITILK